MPERKTIVAGNDDDDDGIGCGSGGDYDGGVTHKWQS